MGITDRVSRIIRANINDLLDRAEDPEIMIDQILRDMASSIDDARGQVATMVAQEKLLEGDFAEAEKLTTAWGEKAERAVAAGKDDLAREALRRKRDSSENAGLYAEQLEVQRHAVGRLKQQLGQLESKYQATLSQRDSLLARQKRARAQRQLTDQISSFSPFDPTADLERMERKIRQDEAEAAALLELDDTSFDQQFAELDADDAIEAELAALKSLGPGN
ncbi:MAG: PspA/IM30 family protein [Thermomicrobiales bacterium]|jgi:phage shock protein A|nr:PspA/IM30 family protein [Thermomicrobiales bacterium]